VSQSTSPTPLWVVGAVVGSFAAFIILGPRTLGPALALGGGAIAWALWRRWRIMKGERSVLTGLRAHWATLPGASWVRDVVEVHHGDRPISVALSHDGGQMRARIATPMGDQPMAFRIWRDKGERPALTPDGVGGSGPELARAPLVESWLAGRFQAESNDEERLGGLVGESALAALFSVADALGDGLDGVVYDGRHVTVALNGPVVADPERAAHLARVIWRAFVP